MKRTSYLSAVLLFAAVVATAPAAAQQREGFGPPATAKDPLATARDLYRAGQWAAARYEFTKAPRSVETETFAALCAARAGDPGAGEQLEGLLKRYPASPYTNEVRLRAGLARYDEGDYEGALKALAAVDERRLPGSERDELHFKRGHALFATGMAEDSRAEFAKVSAAGEYAPHARYYTAYMDYTAGDYAAARPVFQSLAADPAYEALMPYYLIQIEYAEGNWSYVAEHADRLIPETAMPRRAELAGMAAQSWFHLGDYDRALGHIESYGAMGGAMGRMEHYTAGFSLYRAGRYDEAEPHLAAATGADDAMSQNASYHLADIYLNRGDKARAMQSFSIAAASGADAAIAEDALFNYGKLLFDTDAGRFNEAINVLTRYIADYPNGGQRVRDAREYLIAAYYNSRDYDAAYAAIMQLPDPDNDVRAALQKITYFRALGRMEEGDAAAAERLLAESLTHRHNAKYTALAAFWQGELLYSRGQYAEAIGKYEEYLRLSPATEAENRMARYNLGYANFNLSQWAAAGRWFDDFLGRHAARDDYRADALNRVGDIRHAERAYWRAIESYDESARMGTDLRYYSAFQRAMMLGLVDRPERKIESLGAIVASNEGDYVERAAYELGRYYISLDRFADGARELEKFVAAYPASTLRLSALSSLGLAYLNMGDRERSMRANKAIVERAPYSPEARDAMETIRGMYVEAGDVDGYFAYARETGAPADTGEAQRDSLTFTAAERLYMSGDAARAIPALESYVAGRGEHIPTALGYLSGLYAAAERHSAAAGAYRRHADLATDPAVRRRAVEGYVKSVIAAGDAERIKAMADEVASMADVPEASLREASFAKAQALRAEGRADEAMVIYRTLAADPSTAAGAESAYRVIERMFAAGDYRGAETAVFALSQSGTRHSYWLGQAFLTLGDIYVREGDSFQARATYQSIVDGYSPADDGVVAAAKQRISTLK